MNISKKNLLFFVLVGIVSVVLIAIYINNNLYRTKASGVHSTGTYTDWHWPSTNYNNFKWQITPNNEQEGPDSYFYSHQFGLTNGEAGYSGIQGDRNGKRAIFSIWNALDARGPEIARPFDGEGVGFQTMINYPWIVGHTYAFKVERMNTEATGTWWGAWVTDSTTDVTSFIGQIKVPTNWGGLHNWSIVWIERYGGPMNTCTDIHYANANFTNFTANNGVDRPTRHDNHLASPIGCPGSLVTDITSGVRHEMGIGNPLSPIITDGVGTPISDLEWVSVVNGSGPAEKNMSNGEPPPQDGKLLTINHQRYEKGLGVHALSDIRYALNGQYSSFTSDIGLDDESGDNVGSVVFQVWADNNQLYDSGVMSGLTPVKKVNVDVANVRELRLVVTDGGDGINWDHADWANARLIAALSSPTSAPTPVSSPTTTPTISPTLTTAPTMTPTSTPIPTPTPSITPSQTTISLSILLHGIGKGGDSANPGGLGTQNPQRMQRQVTVEIFNAQNQLVLTKSGTINYDSTLGGFRGTIDLGNTFPAGVYAVKIKTPQFLKAIVPGIQTVKFLQENTFPATTLIAGDINGDNRLDVLDYNLLMDCYSDLEPAINCTDITKKLSADLTDEGEVNQFDYNLFLRELTNRTGE